MAFSNYVVIQNKSLQHYLDTNGNWTSILSEARRFNTRAEAKRYMQVKDIEGYDIYIQESK
jgi:hypothetical protein